MAGEGRKYLAIIGGLIIGIGVTYFAKTVSGIKLKDELWIGIGIVLTISAATSLYFMGKGNN